MATAVESSNYVIERAEAQRSSTLVQAVALLLAGVCIAGAAALQKPINQQRRELQLITQSDLYKQMPPQYVWVSAVAGSFRGLVADLLWMRAENLKQEGKYYESHNLAKWICTLQPRFPAVWQFQAWNMSYNISVGTHTAPERWQWVYNGIRLIRDEGIPHNEKFVPLYHQIAWTWFHKVGDRLDDYHWFYKRRWAATMEILLGAPPAGVSNAETIDWFRPVAEAPHAFAQLTAARPGTAALAAQLSGIGIDIHAETNSQRVYHPLEEKFFIPYTAWLKMKARAVLSSRPARIQELNPQLNAILEAAEPQDVEALLAYLRSKVLREQYKMDPQYMLDLTGQLGTAEPIPIDWRTPWAHALYWGFHGTQLGREAKSVKEFDLINTDRIALFSLQKLAQMGRLVFQLNLDEPMDSYIGYMPDIRYIEAMHNKYVELGQKYKEPSEGNIEGRTCEMLQSGHVNYLESSIVNLYLAGRESDAQKWLEYLAKYYKELDSGQTKERYLQGLDQFVFRELGELIDSSNEVSAILNSLFNSAHIALASGWNNQFNSAMELAAKIHRKYQADKKDDRQGRRALPTFVQMRADALQNYVLYGDHPVEYRSMVWQREADEVKRYAYDNVAPHVAAMCEKVGFDVNRAFPEPPGMAKWRADHPERSRPENMAAEEIRKQQDKKYEGE
jgi:hypothetical protein